MKSRRSTQNKTAFILRNEANAENREKASDLIDREMSVSCETAAIGERDKRLRPVSIGLRGSAPAATDREPSCVGDL